MAKYCGRKMLCNVLLASFVVTWIVSRLGFYPFRSVAISNFTTKKWAGCSKLTMSLVSLKFALQKILTFSNKK